VLLLKVLGDINGPFDVTLLRRLVSTGKQQNKPVSALRVIDAVSRPEVNLQLGYTISQVAMKARIAVNQPVNANLDAGSASTVFKCIDPVEIGFCLIHTRETIVACRLRFVKLLDEVMEPMRSSAEPLRSEPMQA
jgi:hypothetical protein